MMAVVPRDEAAKYMFEQKYPKFMRNHPSPTVQAEMRAFRETLDAMPEDELQALYAREKDRERREAQARIDQEEQKRFFNDPCAKADFVHWSKAAHWTLDEAVALALGSAPEHVNWTKIKPLTRISPFATQFTRLRDLATRARAAGQLSDPVDPASFLAWAKRNDIAFPPELERQVTAYAHHVAHGKTLSDQAEAQLDEHIKASAARCSAQETTIEKPSRRPTHFEQTVEKQAAEKPLLTKERESALKLIIGMAVKGYGYRPTAGRNQATAEIAGDLELLGIPLDPDTVRKWLKEAAELLTPESSEKFDR